MLNETVEQFLARGGEIRLVGVGQADETIKKLQEKTLSLNSRYRISDLEEYKPVVK